jgi:hypothetical protein
MAKIIGIDGMTHDELNRELAAGARFVIFQYTISLLVITVKRGSNIHFIKSGQSASSVGLPFTLITALLGWWGIPWGPIYSIQALHCNLSGGKDVTQSVTRTLTAG